MANEVATSDAPAEEELRTLREEVDPEGVYLKGVESGVLAAVASRSVGASTELASEVPGG